MSTSTSILLFYRGKGPSKLWGTTTVARKSSARIPPKRSSSTLPTETQNGTTSRITSKRYSRAARVLTPTFPTILSKSEESQCSAITSSPISIRNSTRSKRTKRSRSLNRGISLCRTITTTSMIWKSRRTSLGQLNRRDRRRVKWKCKNLCVPARWRTMSGVS